MNASEFKKAVSNKYGFDIPAKLERRGPCDVLVPIEDPERFWKFFNILYDNREEAEDFRQRLADMTNRLDECVASRSAAEQKVHALESQCSNLEGQLNTQARTIDGLRERNEELLREVEEKNEQLKRCDELRKRAKTIKQEAEAKQRECWQNTLEPEAKSERLRSEIAELEKRLSDFREFVAILQGSAEQLQERGLCCEEAFRADETIGAAEAGLGNLSDKLIQKLRDDKKCYDERLAAVKKDCEKWDWMVSEVTALARLCEQEDPAPFEEGSTGGPAAGPGGGFDVGVPGGPFEEPFRSAGSGAGQMGETADRARLWPQPATVQPKILEETSLALSEALDESLESELEDDDIVEDELDLGEETGRTFSERKGARDDFSFDLEAPEPLVPEPTRSGTVIRSTTEEVRTPGITPQEPAIPFDRMTQAPATETERITGQKKAELQWPAEFLPPPRKPDDESQRGGGGS